MRASDTHLTGSMPSFCIFCGGCPLTREHIWAQLVPRVPPAHASVLSFRSDRSKRGQNANAQLEENFRRPEEQKTAHRLQEVQQ